MYRRFLGPLVIALPVLLVFLVVSACGFVLLAGDGPVSFEARLLRGWCGVLLIALVSDLILIVSLLGFRAWTESDVSEPPSSIGD